MAYYTGKTWRDRQVEHAGRRILTNVSTSETMTVDVERAEGAVSVAGNPFNAAQMNDLESRVTAGFTTTETEVNKKITGDGIDTNLTNVIGTGSSAKVPSSGVVKSLYQKLTGAAVVTLAAANWSVSTTLINNVAYYYYIAQLTKIYSEHPAFSIGAAGTLPTKTEEEAYDLINYAIADTSANTITFYAEDKPTSQVIVIVKEAE